MATTQQVTDSELERAARDTLEHHPGLDARQIDLSVQDGVLTLEGWVPDEGQRALAERLCAEQPGARQVDNNLNVQVTDTAELPLLPQHPRGRARF